MMMLYRFIVYVVCTCVMAVLVGDALAVFTQRGFCYRSDYIVLALLFLGLIVLLTVDVSILIGELI